MRKYFLLLPVLCLFALTAGCGGSGGSATGTVGTSTVNIRIGEDGRTARITVEKYPLLAKVGAFVRDLLDTTVASAAIPSDVTHIVFTISAPDMTTITRDVQVAGKSSVSESFTVPNGANRHFLVEALYLATVHYRKETSANLDGRPITLVLDMEDVTPPSFAGLVSSTVVSTTRIDLSWNPATDNVTPSSQLTYQIYMASASGGQNFSSPSFTTEPGATSYSVTGLNPGTSYYFVVRCSDVDGGNQDTNTVEKSATTMRASDTTPPSFAGLVSAVAPAGTADRADLTWGSASDDRTAAKDIVYLVYMATTSGGENYSSPNFTTPAGVTAFSVNGLNPGATYYFVVRARDSAGNMDSNTVERSVTISDTTPPSFAGLVSASQPSCGSGQINLSWNSATDNITPSSDIVYYVYISTTSGGQNFASPSYSTAPGVTSYSITGLSAGTYYVVVRARDANGNTDANTIQIQVTIAMIC